MAVHRPASREEWLQLRHKNISSTESSALFGMSAYLTAYELGVIKQSKEPTEIETSERMRWGTRLQDAIAVGISVEYGVVVQALTSYITVDGIGMGASFDYEIIGLKTEKSEKDEWKPELREMFKNFGPGILEIKNVDSLVFKNEWTSNENEGEEDEANEGEIEAPDHIEIQVQHQLECADEYEWTALAVLVGGNQAHVFPRMRDRTVGAGIRKKITKFWDDLKKGILPEIKMPEDADIIIKLHQLVEPDKLFDGRGNEQLSELAKLYHLHGVQLKQLAEERKVARAKILQIIGDSQKALLDGFSVSTSLVGETQISYTRQGYRMFRITEKKGGKNKSRKG